MIERGNNMLDHDNLEEFADPINYDKQDSSDVGVEFYSSLAKEIGGPVLEIACGTGRVTIPIARLGFSVTGLDIVPAMLDQARSKSAGLPARWVDGDARTFDLGERFRLIFMTGNAFQAFVTNVEQANLLQRVHAHLENEGWFAFETRNPLFPNTEISEGFFVPLETNTEEEHWPSSVNVNGHEVRVSTTRLYDHVGQILHLISYKRWYEAGKEHTKTTRTALRYTFPQELTALLHYNGFTLLRQFGDWDLKPLTATSPSIISVCGKHS
jgi:SAM-dependent methyltransferase